MTSTKAVEITFVILLKLVTAFNQGLHHVEAEEHEKAVAAFSQVIGAEANLPDLLDYSRYYRAASYLKLDKKEQAFEDLVRLIRSTNKADLRSRALALYKKAEGPLAALRLKESPKQAMQKFLAAVGQNNEQEARQYITSPLLEMLNMADLVTRAEGRGRGIFQELAREMKDVEFVGEEVAKDGSRATLKITFERHPMTFELLPRKDHWTFARLTAVGPREQRRPVPVANVAPQGIEELFGEPPRRNSQNQGHLKMLFRGLILFRSQSGGSMPKSLSEVQKFVGGQNTQWIHPTTGKPHDFLYRPDLTVGADKMVIAAPQAVDGKRMVS